MPALRLAATPPPMSASFNVFLVEDHPAMREAYAAVLAQEPDIGVCGVVESAEQALDALDGLPCDLVVTDLRLPGMSGVDLVQRLRMMRPDLPALVISAHEEEVYAERAREAGAVGFLPKQGLAGTLVPTIREVLEAASNRPR